MICGVGPYSTLITPQAGSLFHAVLHRGHHPFGVRGGRLVGGSSFPGATPERAGFRAYQTYLCDGYGVSDGIIAAFAQALDAPTRTALCLWIETDLARLPPRPTRIRQPGA